MRLWRFSGSFLSGIRLSAVSVPLGGTKFAGPLVALHLPLSLSRALLSLSLTGRGLFTALFISLSVGNAQAELPLGRQVSARAGAATVCISLNKGSASGLGRLSVLAPEGPTGPQPCRDQLLRRKNVAPSDQYRSHRPRGVCVLPLSSPRKALPKEGASRRHVATPAGCKRPERRMGKGGLPTPHLSSIPLLSPFQSVECGLFRWGFWEPLALRTNVHSCPLLPRHLHLSALTCPVVS